MTQTTSRPMNAAIEPDLDTEQSTAIIEAILAGKYSWACVLMLRSAGHNPLHYIPYRTYNRLLKEEMQKRSTMRNPTATAHPTRPKATTKTQINDLAHIESLAESPSGVVGGTHPLKHGILLRRTAQNATPSEPQARTGSLPIWQLRLSEFQYM